MRWEPYVGSFYIGAFSGIEGHTPSNHFDGFIDDVRFYDRILSEQEARALYEDGGWD